MRAVQVTRRGGPLEVVELPCPEPTARQVRLRVEVCGVCHGEMVAIQGHHPLASYPRVPGHEVIGVIDALGSDVQGWSVGERVGVGWSAGGDEVTGLTCDGGYAEYMVASPAAMVRIPAGMSSLEAAPLMCAGVTTFSALANSGARMGDLVAIQGIGGLGHLAIQFAAKAGFRTVALSRGPQKRALALKLGAHAYIDADAEDPAKVLSAMGGARVILATAPDAKAITRVINGLGHDGALISVAGSGEPIQVSPLQLLMARRTLKGWTADGVSDIEDTLSYSELVGIHPMIETFRLDQAQEALDRMLRAETRFRAVLTIA